MAEIQSSKGTPEKVVPDVRMTRSRDGSNGKAIFRFQKPETLLGSESGDITGMYLIDEEGELMTRDVQAKFVNGQPDSLEATYAIKSVEEWDRFMRFMERYAAEYGLGFNKAES